MVLSIDLNESRDIYRASSERTRSLAARSNAEVRRMLKGAIYHSTVKKPR